MRNIKMILASTLAVLVLTVPSYSAIYDGSTSSSVQQPLEQKTGSQVRTTDQNLNQGFKSDLKVDQVSPAYSSDVNNQTPGVKSSMGSEVKKDSSSSSWFSTDSKVNSDVKGSGFKSDANVDKDVDGNVKSGFRSDSQSVRPDSSFKTSGTLDSSTDSTRPFQSDVNDSTAPSVKVDK